jgi:hypothetical protein
MYTETSRSCKELDLLQNQAGSREAPCEYSEHHYARPHPVGAVHRLGDCLRPDGNRLCDLYHTVAQVAFAALVLAALGFGFNPAPYDLILMGFVTVFTLASVSLYLRDWVRHMSTIEAI